MAGKKKYFNLSPSNLLLHKMIEEMENQKKGKVSDKRYRESLANNLAAKYNHRRGI